MRIAMLTNNYLPFIGGVPISIKRLADGLRSLGHVVYVFAPSYEGQQEEDYVIRYRSTGGKLSNGCVIPDFMDSTIRKEFENKSFDIIHVHHPMLIGYTALYLGKKYRIPVVYTYHTRYEQYLHYLPFYRKLQNRHRREKNYVLKNAEEKIMELSEQKLVSKSINTYTKYCDLVLAPTKLMKEILIEQGTSTEIKILPTGLKDDSFEPDREQAIKLRNKYLKDNQFLFCTVSRLEQEKNLSFLLQSMRELKENYQERFHLLILGDGTYREELEQQVERMGLQGQITFVGSVAQKEINHYYKACDLFVFASKSETQGIVLLEAMAVGLPVVAVKASGVNDIVINGENGFTTIESKEEFAYVIRDLLSCNERYKKISDGALRTARKYCNSKIAKAAEQYYTEAIVYKEVQYAFKKRNRRNGKKNLPDYHTLLS